MSAARACQPPQNCGQYQPQPQVQIQPPYQLNFPAPQAFPRQNFSPLNCVFTKDSTTATYDCVSTNATVRTQADTFDSLDGSHVSNHSNLDVDGLKISSQICRYVPRGVGQLVGGLKKLEIT